MRNRCPSASGDPVPSAASLTWVALPGRPGLWSLRAGRDWTRRRTWSCRGRERSLQQESSGTSLPAAHKGATPARELLLSGLVDSGFLKIPTHKGRRAGQWLPLPSGSCGRVLSLGGMAAPSMKERQACWGARDAYWKCLDEHTEDASQCQKLRSSFESSCPQQWVSA